MRIAGSSTSGVSRPRLRQLCADGLPPVPLRVGLSWSMRLRRRGVCPFPLRRRWRLLESTAPPILQHADAALEMGGSVLGRALPRRHRTSQALHSSAPTFAVAAISVSIVCDCCGCCRLFAVAAVVAIVAKRPAEQPARSLKPSGGGAVARTVQLLVRECRWRISGGRNFLCGGIIEASFASETMFTLKIVCPPLMSARFAITHPDLRAIQKFHCFSCDPCTRQPLVPHTPQAKCTPNITCREAKQTRPPRAPARQSHFPHLQRDRPSPPSPLPIPTGQVYGPPNIVSPVYTKYLEAYWPDRLWEN